MRVIGVEATDRAGRGFRWLAFDSAEQMPGVQTARVWTARPGARHVVVESYKNLLDSTWIEFQDKTEQATM